MLQIKLLQGLQYCRVWDRAIQHITVRGKKWETSYIFVCFSSICYRSIEVQTKSKHPIYYKRIVSSLEESWSGIIRFKIFSIFIAHFLKKKKKSILLCSEYNNSCICLIIILPLHSGYKLYQNRSILYSSLYPFLLLVQTNSEMLNQ